ncbi:MAG: enoyl-CoA hydratase/isomerase family protein [Pseudomonadota bacterium]
MSATKHEPSPHVLCRAENALGRITLARPKALNALTNAMREEISRALTAWQRDPMIYAVMIDAEGDRAFCAGGDLREMLDGVRSNPAAARAALADEYRLNWQLDCFTKPIVSLIDGLCVGSGVGLTLFGTHRVAGENYSFAMPEAAVGFFPDVGATWPLSRLSGHIGRYLAISGRSMLRGDARRHGLATHCIPAQQFEQIRDALRDAQPIDPLLDDADLRLPPETDDATAQLIADAFSASDVFAVQDRLEAARQGTRSQEVRAFADALLVELRQLCPISRAVAHRQLGASAPRNMEEAIRQDFRLAARMIERPDFAEGVRAMLIDKDHAPEWSPAMLTDVAPAALDALFATHPDFEIDLPPRPQAISAIA